MWNSDKVLSLFTVSQEFSGATKLSFWQGHWALGYHSMKFRHFTDIFQFP